MNVQLCKQRGGEGGLDTVILESSSVSKGGPAVPDGLLLDHRSLWNEWNCLLVQRSQRS